MTTGYGRLHGSVEGNANSLYWAIDNRIYTTGTDLYLTEKDGVFEVRKTLSRGEWGATQDDAGRIYRNSSESALQVDLVPTPYFARNPLMLRTRGSYEALRGENDEVNTVWPVRPNPGANRAYQLGITRTDGTLERNTAACGPLVYRGDRLPADLYGNVFVAEPSANLISRIIVSDDGTTITARKAYEKAEFIASTDERFRPVYMANAPDGTLYVVDFYRGILQNRASTTVYLRDYATKKHLEQPIDMGRIYRVVHETTVRDTSPLPASASPGAACRDVGASERLAPRHRATDARGAGWTPAGESARRRGHRARRTWRGLPATGARACTRCGRSTDSIGSTRRS